MISYTPKMFSVFIPFFLHRTRIFVLSLLTSISLSRHHLFSCASVSVRPPVKNSNHLRTRKLCRRQSFFQGFLGGHQCRYRTRRDQGSLRYSTVNVDLLSVPTFSVTWLYSSWIMLMVLSLIPKAFVFWRSFL